MISLVRITTGFVFFFLSVLPAFADERKEPPTDSVPYRSGGVAFVDIEKGVRRASMLYHDALRLTGRAGGINHISKITGQRGCVERAIAQLIDDGRVFLQRNDLDARWQLDVFR